MGVLGRFMKQSVIMRVKEGIRVNIFILTLINRDMNMECSTALEISYIRGALVGQDETERWMQKCTKVLVRVLRGVKHGTLEMVWAFDVYK